MADNSTDNSLQEQLKQVHYILGEQATDVANKVMSTTTEMAPQLNDLIKDLSSLASKISQMVVESKAINTIPVGKAEDYESVSNFAKKLGNTQYQLLGLTHDLVDLQKGAEAILNKGFLLGDEIMDLQEELMEVRSHLDSLGVFSNNPKLREFFARNN